MTTVPRNLTAIAKTGLDALNRQDFTTARDALQQVTGLNTYDVSIWFALSQAHAGLGDFEPAVAALDRVLNMQPTNVRALISKADHLNTLGNTRAAAAHYQTALRHAPPKSAAPKDIVEGLERAQMMCERFAGLYRDHLMAGLEAAGYKDTRAPRVAQSLDIMFGRRRIYFQQPRFFYFPGLPNIEFYERSQFPWMEEVEAATPNIRAELLTVLRDEAAFTPYVEGDPNLPRTNQSGMFNNPNWGAFYLRKNGTLLTDHVARCPKTHTALNLVPMPDASQRCPSVLFSLLKPKTRIPAHHGFLNTRLICHLPLIVPEGCGFRVGGEVRKWQEGKAWAFDDTIEHEAWNDSDQLRVILIFEIWRPELNEEERRLITAMFRSIDAYSTETPNWDI